jgi:hypothetical protein
VKAAVRTGPMAGIAYEDAREVALIEESRGVRDFGKR